MQRIIQSVCIMALFLLVVTNGMAPMMLNASIEEGNILEGVSSGRAEKYSLSMIFTSIL